MANCPLDHMGSSPVGEIAVNVAADAADAADDVSTSDDGSARGEGAAEVQAVAPGAHAHANPLDDEPSAEGT